MNEIASHGQIRWSFARWAMVTVPGIVLLGTLSGLLAGSGEANAWYAALAKPSFQPPGWAFGIVWPLLYIGMGLALALILNARGARGRPLAITLFAAQLVLNLLWSPVFFAAHQVGAGLVIILLLLTLVAATIVLFWRIRPVAGALLLPYLAWLCFAAALNWSIMQLNPGGRGDIPAASTQIGAVTPLRR